MGKILTNVGDKRKLQVIFGVSRVTVRKALNGETKSALAHKIRKVAIEELGGMEVNR